MSSTKSSSILKSVPSTDTILRHVSPRHIDQDDDSDAPVILGSAFVSRPRDEGAVSYNWIEYFQVEKSLAIAEIRSLARMQYKKSHRLVSLNVGVTIDTVNQNHEAGTFSEVLQDPVPENSKKPADNSHCLMTNIPDAEDIQSQKIGDLIAMLVQEIFPAIP